MVALSDLYDITIGNIDPSLGSGYQDIIQSAIDCWRLVLTSANNNATVLNDGRVTNGIIVDVQVLPSGTGTPIATGSAEEYDPISGLPRRGVITLFTPTSYDDSCEWYNRTLSVMKHEIGHTLGFNGNTPSFVANQIPGFYTGPEATSVWQAAGGTGNPPMEVPTFSNNSHWFVPVMNGDILGGREVPLPGVITTLTVAALADIGYNVDYTHAHDTFIDLTAQDGEVTLKEYESRYSYCAGCPVAGPIQWQLKESLNGTKVGDGKVVTATVLSSPTTPCGTLSIVNDKLEFTNIGGTAGTCSWDVMFVIDGVSVGVKSIQLTLEECPLDPIGDAIAEFSTTGGSGPVMIVG